MHTLACVHQRRLARRFEQSVCLLVAEFESLLHRRHLLLGRVAQSEPEQRAFLKPVECGPHVLDLPGLSFVEHKDREHLPLFPESAAFPCPWGDLLPSEPRTPKGSVVVNENRGLPNGPMFRPIR